MGVRVPLLALAEDGEGCSKDAGWAQSWAQVALEIRTQRQNQDAEAEIERV